ncbi:MAG TPA: OmpA family protein [Ohtaekwangia sp.]|uniref:OmpA family protein n=1 Tax=Ohtaekwangia sp. TaxID=2066019 RepID=UPI002F9503B1
MKKRITRASLIALFTLISAVTYAQHYYVVVGVFAVESNAQKFTGYVRSLRYSAQYELNTAKNQYYVYVLRTNNHEEGLAKVKSLQAGTELNDAWLFTGRLGTGTEPIADVPVEKPVVTEEPVTTPSVDTTAVADVPPPSTDTVTTEGVVPEKVRGKLFKFEIQMADGRPVNGEIHRVDFSRGRDVAVYRSNQYIDITRPADNSPMSLVCGIFGYKEVVKQLDYGNPAAMEGATQDAHGAWVIPYKLERMKKRDVSVMYHVSFYKDAVIMLPQSKSEMDELVSMMKDNPAYKIKIHGHCNGTNSRKIIALGQTRNYFDVKGSEEKTGSAKDLSRMRAEAVQAYLEENGVEKNRSSVYAWGGLNMLVPENSTSAPKLNDRIEIEITAD